VDVKITDVSLGTSDKQSAERMRADRLRDLEHERAGIIPKKATREAAQRKLKEHLLEMVSDLRAKGRNPQYLAEFENRFELLMKECHWELAQDMTSDSFVKWRSEQDKAPKTLNEYLIGAKGFANWMVAQGRMAANPLALVQKVETRGKEVRRRRAYTDAEFAALLVVAGEQRIVYLIAALTGIRHGELKKLRWNDFTLAGDKPSVTVRASVSKNHKQACLPLHTSLVAALAQFRPGNALESDLVFKGIMPRSELFNEHLKTAKITKVDAEGRVVDFHSLRHTFCTNLHRAGVPQREAMELMRHNDPRLTAKTYTDTSLLALRTAVEKIGGPASQLASQKLGAASQSVSSPVIVQASEKSNKAPSNTGSLSLADMAWRVLTGIEKWCAIQGSNL
jgi:integrase